MKRIISVALIALSLAGCAQLSTLETAIKLGTASASNPVTPTRLYEMENAVALVFTGLNAWKKSCIQGLINATCKQQIRTVQIYTMQIPPYLKELRAFVRNNDQVNATVLFNELTSIIGTVNLRPPPLARP